MQNNDLDSPGKRLRHARVKAGFTTAKDAARKAGIGGVSWRAYENDQHGFSRHATNIAQVLGCSVQWLLDGGVMSDDDLGPSESSSLPLALSGEQVEAIRKVDISYAMGDGSVIEDYPETEMMPFNLSFLQRFAKGSTEQLFIASGHGESMEPTLRRDDMIMIDTSQNRVAYQDQIWALTFADVGMVKRVRRLTEGKFSIISDNPNVPVQEVNEADLHIVGKVVWVARMMG